MTRVLTAPIALLAALLTTHTAHAQVRLELRLRAQDGVPPSSVTDVGGNQHNISFSAGNRRFELQYRLIDTNTQDGLSPCGLAFAQIDIVGTQQSGEQWTLARAQLSRFEAQLAASVPPTSPDTSGLPNPTGAFTGLHRPFRTALNSNDNSNSNGVLAQRQITGVTPLAISSSMQGPCGGADAGAWFGLYSFDVVLPSPIVANITLTATARPDASSGAAFAYWSTSGASIPTNGFEATVATGVVLGDPGAPLISACCLGHTCFIISTPPQTCAQSGAVPANSNTCVAAPATCCPADVNGGGVTIQDLFDFLTLWFASDSRADFNRGGGVTIQDLFDYLTAWFAGC